MNRRITKEEIEKLYLKWKTPKHVIAHCRAVASVAVTLGRELNKNGYSLDLSLIRGSALAHDVARVEEEHAVKGAEILEDLGYGEEAAIVRVHMTYPRFHEKDQIDECDLVCLADRLVMEDRYVGLDARMEYIMNKAPGSEEIREHIMEGKVRTKNFIAQIESDVPAQ